MGIKVANNAFATLAAGISNSDTSITVSTGQGARFPALGAGDYFYATLINTSNQLEIVECTARSGDVLTVVRAQESTAARAYDVGDRIEIRITAQTFADATSNAENFAYTGTLTGGTGVVNLGSGQLVKDANGNVAIGRTTALEQLHVAGNIRTDAQFHAEATDTAAAPGYAWRADTDTGIFRAAVDAIGFSTVGSERMRINSAGKILAAAGTNWVGTVSQNGLSSIIERGSNANGSFTKFADGTVLMSIRGVENRSSTGVVSTQVTYPVVLSENVASGFGGALATLNTAVPATAKNISVNNTDSTTDINIRIDRSTTTNSLFYVFVHGRWY